jgi:hypothetical protein
MIDAIMNFLTALAAIAIGWLPESPFVDIGVGFESFKNVMGMINYFVPVGTMLGIFTTYLFCVLAWYAARWILRLTKYID